MSIADLKDISLAIAAIITICTLPFTLWKTSEEIKKLREERGRERRSRIHEKQLDILRELYAALQKIQHYSQRMASSFILKGEKPEEYPDLFYKAWNEAYSLFISSRLILPKDIISNIENFFQQLHVYDVNLGITKSLNQNVAEYWNKAQEISHKEIPAILLIIEEKARVIIHKEDA